jgi:hypothetical protein
VSNSAHVDALTNSESLAPRWARQSAPASLSAISLSAVAASGDSEQRLGEAHQHHAFARGQVVLAEQRVDATRLALTRAYRDDEIARIRLDACGERGSECRARR